MNIAFSENKGTDRSEPVSMQTNKLKTLLGVDAVAKLHTRYSEDNRAWVIDITYSDKQGDSITESLERQRGGIRKFARLDGIAGYLSELGVHRFTVDTASYEK